MRILSSLLTLALSAPAIAQSVPPASLTAANSAPVPSVPVNVGVSPAVASVPTAPVIPAMNLPAVPSSTPSPVAVNPSPAPVMAPGLAPEPEVPMDLDATTIRLSSHLKSLIDIEKLRSQLDSERQNRARTEWKFEADQKAAMNPGAAANASGSSSSPGSSVEKTPPLSLPTKPYATSVYSFGKNAYAKIVLDGSVYVAVPGRTLPNGARVISVSGNGVILSQHGRRVFVPVQGAGMVPYTNQP